MSLPSHMKSVAHLCLEKYVLLSSEKQDKQNVLISYTLLRLKKSTVTYYSILQCYNINVFKLIKSDLRLDLRRPVV